MIGQMGTSGSIVGDVVNNGVLAFERSDSIAFTGVISGSGMVDQLGPGILTLKWDQYLWWWFAGWPW